MKERSSAQARRAAVAAPYRADLAQALAADVLGVPLRDIRAETRRQPRVALARQIAMYLSHVVFKMSHTQIAKAFGRDRTTARYAFHHIENLRDDPELDRIVRHLEALLRGKAELRS